MGYLSYIKESALDIVLTFSTLYKVLKRCDDSEILHQALYSNGGGACNKLESYTEKCGGGVGIYH